MNVFPSYGNKINQFNNDYNSNSQQSYPKEWDSQPTNQAAILNEN